MQSSGAVLSKVTHEFPGGPERKGMLPLPGYQRAGMSFGVTMVLSAACCRVRTPGRERAAGYPMAVSPADE
jgi:hypothetical protein